ncbi:hypothetical protein PFISCL1PPCAC_21642, partial [Pristionchus fissidentatus]
RQLGFQSGEDDQTVFYSRHGEHPYPPAYHPIPDSGNRYNPRVISSLPLVDHLGQGDAAVVEEPSADASGDFVRNDYEEREKLDAEWRNLRDAQARVKEQAERLKKLEERRCANRGLVKRRRESADRVGVEKNLTLTKRTYLDSDYDDYNSEEDGKGRKARSRKGTEKEENRKDEDSSEDSSSDSEKEDPSGDEGHGQGERKKSKEGGGCFIPATERRGRMSVLSKHRLLLTNRRRKTETETDRATVKMHLKRKKKRKETRLLFE